VISVASKQDPVMSDGLWGFIIAGDVYRRTVGTLLTLKKEVGSNSETFVNLTLRLQRILTNL
jgi:hypothetical protein